MPATPPRLSRNIWIATALVVLLMGLFIRYALEERQVSKQNDLRTQTLLLADELRQSSDDLTRMVRTYVVTGDTAFKQHYQDILDIRNGTKPRPPNYQSIYWDYVSAGESTPSSIPGRNVALLDLLRDAGCSPQELALLSSAKEKSDQLARIELDAMSLAESATQQDPQPRVVALAKLHDKAYHQAKVGIMQPIGAFYDSVNQRTAQTVERAQAHASWWRLAFIVAGLGLIAFVAHTSLAMRKALGDSVENVQEHLARIGRGDFATPIHADHADAKTVLAGLAQTQRNLYRMDQDRQAAQAARSQALRDAQTVMDALNAHSIVSIADQAGTIIFANERFSTISGYSHEELIGQNHRIVKSPVQSDSYWSEMWKTISSGYVWRDTVCNRAKDGHLYWVDTVVAPYFGEHGIEKYISIRTDVTALKLAESALQESAAKLRDDAAFLARAGRIAGVGRWQWELSQDLLDWSDYTCHLHDVAPGTRPTLQQAVQFFAPEARDNIQNAIKAAMQTGRPWDLELPLNTAMNRRIWVRTAGEAEYHDGKRIRLVGIFQDVSERRKLEDALHQKNTLMKTILDNLPIGLSVFDSHLHLIADNQNFRTLLDFPNTLFEGEVTTFESIIRFNAERGEYGDSDHEASIRSIVERAKLARPHHYQRTRADGTTLEIRGAPMPSGGFVTTYSDVSDLARATIAAQEASKSKSQFVANMSHEIRTPMNAILGMLSLLLNTELSARQQDYVTKADGAAKSLLGLLNDVLDFSKMEAGKMVLDPQPFHLDRLMRDLAVILSANVGNKAIEVLFDIDPEVPKVLIGDALRLQQILINLGGNAIKFTTTGQVVVQIKKLRHEGEQCTLYFAVTDSGIGIAPENQARIFDGFSQAEASTTRRYGGTGLGLSICKRLVELMGGALELFSVLDQGSTFSFTINLKPADGITGEAGTERQPLHEPLALRVMVVDDNPIARDLLCSMARSWNWEVLAADSGAQALELIESRAAESAPALDVVLVDWHMPGMDGWETIARIREHPAQQHQPVTILVTAHGRETLVQRSAREQASLNAFLVKPITASMLFDTVMNARAGKSNLRTRPRSQDGSRGRLEGMHLLVVEDNHINQQVALELLSAEGALVKLADNGELGVAAVARAHPPYHAVLMDLQMPVMDGYAATRAIRTELGLTQLPIIAMTANAMASDREGCLQAGMNDHVGKPFELSHLVEVLLQQVRRNYEPTQTQALSSRDAAHQVDQSSPPTASPGDTDAPGAIARLGGNAQLYGQVLSTYLRDIATLPDKLDAMLHQHDVVAAMQLLHTVKGLSATVGANRMAATAKLMEHSLKNPESAQTQEFFAALQSDFRSAIAHAHETMLVVAKEFVPPSHASDVGAQPTTLAPTNRAALANDLAQLQALLTQSNMEALTLHASLSTNYALHARSEFTALNQALQNFDFVTACAECAALQATLQT